jgi:hypothetical protein
MDLLLPLEGGRHSFVAPPGGGGGSKQEKEKCVAEELRHGTSEISHSKIFGT